ncbi:hypothetical protein ACOMHN_023410 [Nucella lapillus]
METTTKVLLHTLLVSLSSSLSDPFNTTIATTSTSNISRNDSLNDTQMYPLEGGLEPPSWPIYQPIYITVLNAVVFFTGTVGNILVIVVVVMVHDMRTPMNWYLVNLSVADLLVLLVCQPAALAEFFARDRWYLGEALCKIVPFLEHTVLHASTLVILAITVERYYAICRPLKKLALCHRPRPHRVFPVIWTIAALTSLPFVVMTHLEDTLFFDGTPCQVCATTVKEHWHFAYVIGMFVFFFVLPMLLLLCLYNCIIRCLSTSGNNLRIRQVEDVASITTHRTRKNVIKMLVGIVILFFVSLMPVRCVIIWQIFTSDVQIQDMGPESYYNIMWITRLLMYVNSAGNPIIYSLISSKFQEAFWLSLTELHRSWLSPKMVRSNVPLALLPTSERDGQRVPRVLMLKRHRTTSLSNWISSQDSPSSSPLMARGAGGGLKGRASPFVKQRFCTSIV